MLQVLLPAEYFPEQPVKDGEAKGINSGYVNKNGCHRTKVQPLNDLSFDPYQKMVAGLAIDSYVDYLAGPTPSYLWYMKERFLLKDVLPAAYNVMLELYKYETTTGIHPLHKDLIKIRASQINGCAYCLNMHAQDARKRGETEQRIFLISVWRESPQFTEQERTILAMTEEITLISQKGLTEETYQKALEYFGEEGVAQLIMHIISINAWNRIGVSTHRIPGK